MCICTCMLGGLYGEAALRQAQSKWYHDSENNQRLDCLAEVSALTQDHHFITGSHQRPTG